MRMVDVALRRRQHARPEGGLPAGHPAGGRRRAGGMVAARRRCVLGPVHVRPGARAVPGDVVPGQPVPRPVSIELEVEVVGTSAAAPLLANGDCWSSTGLG